MPILPFPWRFSFRQLGVAPDCHWSFREHVDDLKTKAAKRMTILSRIGNATWELGSRILAITSHSFIGLAVYGTHISQQESRKKFTRLLTRAANRIVGAGPTARREILHTLADTKSFSNHYILKSAGALDRVLRAFGATARLTAIKFHRKRHHLNSPHT